MAAMMGLQRIPNGRIVKSKLIFLNLSKGIYTKSKKPSFLLRPFSTTPTPSTSSSSPTSTTSSWWWSKESSTAPPNHPTHLRWWAVPPANAVHLSIGAVYVYSMWTPGMTTALGVVSSAPNDWTHSDVLPVFSAAAVTLGITTSALGSWVERSGPRKAGAVGSLFWASGLGTCALGIHYHSLPLLYLGYGLFGGIGWGLMYLAPVTTVMKWFPDRRGLATGIALSAFGAGAALAPSIIQSMLDYYAVAPDYIGPLQSIASSSATAATTDYVAIETLSDGTQVISSNSPLGDPGQQVIVATESDLARSSCRHLLSNPGVYSLGTGSTGTAPALATLAGLYGALGLAGSRFMQVPHEQWSPTPTTAAAAATATTDATTETAQQQTMTANDDESNKSTPTTTTTITTANNNNNNNVSIGLPMSYVMSQTSQFPLLWLCVFGNATGGLALLSSSKIMITDIWAPLMPHIVTSSFATGYVSALGLGMAFGRFGWSALSDTLGRQNTYAIFGLGIPVVGLTPYLCHSASTAAASASSSESMAVLTSMLSIFYGGSVLVLSCYGGVFSVLPAYIADLFGQKHAGAIHGQLLTAWATSAVVGPMGLAYLRSQSIDHATKDLLSKINENDTSSSLFQSAFNCTVEDEENIQTLIDAKTLTISRLMEFVPKDDNGTAVVVDPTPFLYDSTLYVAAGLMSMSFVANAFMRPIDVKAVLKRLDDKEKEEKKQKNE